MPQTVTQIDMNVARSGLVADSGIVQDTISRLAEDAGGAKAGTFVVPGTNAETQAIAPTATLEISSGTGLGVVMYDASKEPATGAALALGNEYNAEDMLPVVSKGRIWVLCDAAATIVANTPAFVRHVAGAGEVLGAFREDTDGGDATALPNAVFRSAHRDLNFQGETERVALLEISQPTS